MIKLNNTAFGVNLQQPACRPIAHFYREKNFITYNNNGLFTLDMRLVAAYDLTICDTAQQAGEYSMCNNSGAGF